MESTRQLKISKLLQRDLADIFQRESLHLAGGAMVTVTKIHVTRDLSVAKVYLSLFATNDKDELIIKIKKHTKEIRYMLGQRVGKQLRVVPELQFYIDDSLDYIENLENLLDND